MSDKKIYWMSPAPIACDLIGHVGGTHDDITETGVFVDGRTRMGPWANMCQTCHDRHGTGLGTGNGQRYTRQDDGRWLKTSF